MCYDEALLWCLWYTKVHDLLSSRLWYLLQHVKKAEWGHKVPKWAALTTYHHCISKRKCVSCHSKLLAFHIPTHILFECLIPLIPILWLFWTCVIWCYLARNNHIWESWRLLLTELSSTCPCKLRVLRMRPELCKWLITSSCCSPSLQIQTWRVWGYEWGDHQVLSCPGTHENSLMHTWN